jgi:methylated-DNA-[protein]-cysteine S-methyltransferase
MPSPLDRTCLLLHRLDTPIGLALIVTDERGTLRALDYIEYEARMRKLLRIHYDDVELRPATIPTHLKDKLERYFDGEHAAVDGIPCETNGTLFQKRVWKALRAIPAGMTMTYGAIARSFGMPNGSRAVGLANGANPIAIVVPCHRLIAADGALTGYAGGLQRKRWLLEHERVQREPEQWVLWSD